MTPEALGVCGGQIGLLHKTLQRDVDQYSAFLSAEVEAQCRAAIAALGLAEAHIEIARVHQVRALINRERGQS